jgi:hypothetical protein
MPRGRTLPGAEILQLAFEVPRATEALLPRAMHPAIPPYATIDVGDLDDPRPEAKPSRRLLGLLQQDGEARPVPPHDRL